MGDDGWRLVDFDKDCAECHWVEPQKADKLKRSSADMTLVGISGGLWPDVCTKRCPQLSLVLDIDGTLLSELVGDYTDPSELRPHLRPHLNEFLNFAFSACRAVGLWTAAS